MCVVLFVAAVAHNGVVDATAHGLGEVAPVRRCGVLVGSVVPVNIVDRPVVADPVGRSDVIGAVFGGRGGGGGARLVGGGERLFGSGKRLFGGVERLADGGERLVDGGARLTEDGVKAASGSVLRWAGHPPVGSEFGGPVLVYGLSAAEG